MQAGDSLWLANKIYPHLRSDMQRRLVEDMPSRSFVIGRHAVSASDSGLGEHRVEHWLDGRYEAVHTTIYFSEDDNDWLRIEQDRTRSQAEEPHEVVRFEAAEDGVICATLGLLAARRELITLGRLGQRNFRRRMKEPSSAGGCKLDTKTSRISDEMAGYY